MKLTNQDKWNEMVDWAINNRNARESSVEEYWTDTLIEVFGYSKINGEIIIRPSISIGSSNRTIPDIIVSVDDTQLFMVELKQLNILCRKNNEQQLFSYLKQTKGNIGVLICHDIYLYDYDYNKNDDEQIKLKIPFEKNNEDGIKFIELFSKESFDKEKIKQFIQEKIQKERNIAEIKELALDMCYIKDLIIKDLSSLFQREEVEEALKDCIIIETSLPDIDEVLVRPRMPFALPSPSFNKVKIFRLLNGLKNSGQLTEEMIINFQNKEYSNRVFSLAYKLLTDNYIETIDGRGHPRYYNSPQFSFNGKKYYVCSQWWDHCKGLRDDFAKKYGIDLESNKYDNNF